MKVHKIKGRMFVRAPVENTENPCEGCAARDTEVCLDLPRCIGDKVGIFKEVIFKEKQDA